MAIPLENLLAYRHDLSDAVTNEPISSDTQLAALHQPNDTLEGQLLWNLTNTARPAESVTLITPDGRQFPPDEMLSGWSMGPRYYIFLTSRRLLTAPVLKLEVVWEHFESPDAVDNLTVAIDFHFNATDDGTPGIDDLAGYRSMFGSSLKIKTDELRFTTHGATSEGFALARKNQLFLGVHGTQLLKQLQTFLAPQKQRVRLAFTRPLAIAAASGGFAAVLPYITGPESLRLPSLALPEWSALTPLRMERDLREMIDEFSYPMVKFESSDSFATVTDAAVEFYESSRISALEQGIALDEWSKVEHEGILYEVGGVVVMAIRYGGFRSLSGANGLVRFDLPDRLHPTMTWKDPTSRQVFTTTGSTCSVPIRLPAYDALFIINEPSSEIRNASIEPCLEYDRSKAVQVNFNVKQPRFTLQSQLNTVVNMQHPDSHHFHELLKNQHHAFDVVDLGMTRAADATEPVAAAVEQAFQMILGWQKWNAEQMAALRSIRAALGGIVLITGKLILTPSPLVLILTQLPGPAGTGKTLLLQAITAFFYYIGLNVLVLAPANTNCADFMGKLKKHFPDIQASRVFPSSADFDPEKIAKEQHAEEVGQAPKADEDDGGPDRHNDTVNDLLSFEMIRADIKASQDKYNDADYGLQAQVLAAALDGRYEDSGQAGIWKELRACIEKRDRGEFPWLDKKAVKNFSNAYNACKAHFMSLQRMVCTTSGNVRTVDIIDNFARDKHDNFCNGLVIVIDEAAKDREVDTLSALLLPEWRDKCLGLVMLGDERQLQPTNTSAKGSLTFNAFIDRLSIPFISRLKRQGFPCQELREQHRMSHHISKWPSHNFYSGTMRDGPGTKGLLRTKQPGLYACLRVILDSIGSVAQSSDMAEDQRVRSNYIQVLGSRDNSKRSPVVREHVKFFFNSIYWGLRAYWEEELSSNVMIICAYKGAKNAWLEAAGHLQQKHKIPTAQMPQIMTIDSSQGSEATMTIVDASVQRYSARTHRRDIGFVDDDGRMNVALTRAREVRWILGGSCDVKKRRSIRSPATPAYVRYREEVEFTPELTVTENRKLIAKDDDGAWMDEIEKKEVVLSTRYADEN